MLAVIYKVEDLVTISPHLWSSEVPNYGHGKYPTPGQGDEQGLSSGKGAFEPIGEEDLP